MSEEKLRLGLNIDHVATLRNARGEGNPDPIRAAQIAMECGVDGITAHLREDRRHIRDEDVYELKKSINLPLNLEMAATEEMLNIALDVKPNACCIVPENRNELTTEGGLNILGNIDNLGSLTKKLKDAGIRVSLFVDPDEQQLEAAAKIEADIVEIHTGSYCNAEGNAQESELKRIIEAAAITQSLGLECHAGHGLNFDTVAKVAEIPNMVELNIGHFMIGESVFIGLPECIKKMRQIMDNARNKKAA